MYRPLDWIIQIYCCVIKVCSGVFNSKRFYFLCSSFSCIGGLYVILGAVFWFFFIFSTPISLTLSISLAVGPSLPFLVWAVLCLVGFCGSLFLVVFGFILFVRGVLWVVRVSGALCLFLFICYFFVLYSSFLVG